MMKVIRLHMIEGKAFTGTGGKPAEPTHEITRLPGEGYLVRHRGANTGFIVPTSACVAEIVEVITDADDNDVTTRTSRKPRP